MQGGDGDDAAAQLSQLQLGQDHTSGAPHADADQDAASIRSGCAPSPASLPATGRAGLGGQAEGGPSAAPASAAPASTSGAAVRQWDAAPRELDVKQVAKMFWNGLRPGQLDYVHHLEATAPGHRLAPNATPSLIQRKLSSGRNRASAALQPTRAADGQGFVDLHWDSKGTLAPEPAHQFAFSLVRAVNTASVGLKGREPLRAQARVCLFDRQHNRFLGCAASVPPQDLRSKASGWTFDPLATALVVRCGAMQAGAAGGTTAIDPDRVSLLVELNLSYRLTVEDAGVVPQNEAKAATMVDELTSCWALISLRRCAELGREMEVTIPLYMGSMQEPALLAQLLEQQRQAHPFRALFTSAKQPTLTFRAGPLPPSPLVGYGLMPATLVAPRRLAGALAAHRLALAERLAEAGGAGATQPLSDPALAAFGGILDDPALAPLFLDKWQEQCDLLAGPQGCLLACVPGAASPQPPPSLAQLAAAWRCAVLAVAPLLRCSSLPPQHMANFVEYSCHRSAVAHAFAHRINPKTGKALGPRPLEEPLSHASAEFLHRPFDVAETRVCLADQQAGAAGRWL